MQIHRKDKEYRVFQALLRTTPRLEHRLLASSDEEVCLIADLACSHLLSCEWALLTRPAFRSRRVSLAQDPTTPRALRVSSLIGSRLQINPSVLHSHATSKLFVASTMIALASYFALLALIGLMLSTVIAPFEHP
jgi:hypothetical protein